jgi:hypothetical protein
MPVFWAGKPLDDEEELALRRVASLCQRCGDVETAANLERFLPENDHKWTPDQLEFGAHHGPWCDVDAEVVT